MTASTHRPRQPGASLATNGPPRILAFEPIPATFKPRKPAPFHMDLSELLSKPDVQEIAKVGRMAFHCVGDTGGVKRPEVQHLVARGMEESLKTDKMRPSFCYHVGDVIYYNGEPVDYWAQFYEPYEHYPLPIVAIPGNHDGEPLTRQSVSLQGFYENFLAEKPGTFTRESRDSGRAAMCQPWFFWTLQTPFATIIGLYTNVPEHGRLSDDQRKWFVDEMKNADKTKALVIALHHPVYSFDNHHGGSPNMALELQTAINATRRVPNMVVSAHVHNYQRIELQAAGLTIPFFVIGGGGYWNLHYLASQPGYQDPETGAKLISAIDSRHGFMTFEISSKVINGHLTTVPRPQESWSDPNAYNPAFDVFSYPATPAFLSDGQSVTLIPANGSHVPPEIEQGGRPPPRPPSGARSAAGGAAHASSRSGRFRRD